MVRAGSPGVRCHEQRGHNLSSITKHLWNSSNSCPKMWSGSSRRQYPPHENIPDRFYFIVRVRPYHCIHYCSTEEEGGSGPGLINILLSRFPRPAFMPTPDSRPAGSTAMHHRLLIQDLCDWAWIIRMGKLINCRLSSVKLARIGEFMSTFYSVSNLYTEPN